MKTLVNCKQAMGEHKVEFNAEGLPAGIYFYRLQTENHFLTRKMVLLK